MSTNPSDQSIHILGPGAMGLLWASHLAKASWDVTLLYKNNPGSKKASLHYQSAQEESEFPIKQQATTVPIKKLNILLITVKANQLSLAIKPLLPSITKKTLIILTQNGVGSETELYVKYPKLQNNRVLQIVTSHSAIKLQQNKVQQTGFGFCWIGLSQQFHPLKKSQFQQKTVSKLLQLPLIDGWHQNIQSLLWQKLIINASINPLATILCCTNGELLSKDLLPLVTEIVSESCLIARATGLKDFDSSVLLKKVKQVCRDTATNKNSMLVDIINKRPTEIGYINQYLLKQAEKFSIDAPWNLCLTSILNTINHGKI